MVNCPSNVIWPQLYGARLASISDHVIKFGLACNIWCTDWAHAAKYALACSSEKNIIEK